LASGIDAMPDMIAGASKTMLFDQGAVIPLDDYLQYAPNLTNAMVPEDYLTWWREFFDGKIYAIPTIHDVPGSISYMVRADWLKRVGKEIPTTWDELVDVLRAFKAQDANGDGDANNEIPFALDNRFCLDGLMYIFGIMPSGDGQFCILPDKTYSVVYEHPNYQKYTEAVAMLYKEGLLDPEFAVPRNQDTLFQIMDNNTCGFTMTWAERARISTEVNAELIADAEWVCIPPIQGPDGAQMIRSRAKTVNLYYVTVGAEKRGKVEKILQFVNWIYSEEGNRLMNYGIEGVHYQVVDGKPVLVDPYITGFVAARQAGLIHSPFIFNFLPDVYMQLLTGNLSYEEMTMPQQR
ncbi:MAG TPA: extracellular solute-binding protein, partial [Clostridia bacterium]|nr:extracellular solute-binding protein [Clostridia bacterium]